MKKIVWLASFPKSGNTWVRTLLTNLLNGKQEDILNNLVAIGLSSREVLDEHMMLETSELTLREIDNYLPMAIRELANSIKSAPCFLKTHMAYTFNSYNKPIYPADVSIGAIYLVRNVLDVVVSYAHHSNCSIDDMISLMEKQDYIINNYPKDIRPQIPQHYGTWGQHISGWQNQSEIPVLFIRYEDMLADTFTSFKKIVTFSGLNATDEQLVNAVNQSAFEKLQRQEMEVGFKERKSKNALFFRNGKSGSWRQSLTAAQTERIIKTHWDAMLHFNYIDANGIPLY